MRNMPPFANPFEKPKKASPKTAEFLGKVLGTEEQGRYELMMGTSDERVEVVVSEPLENDLSHEELRALEEESFIYEHILLRNVPSWEEFPDEEAIQRDFSVELSAQYKEGRLVSDFDLTMDYLVGFGLSPAKASNILKAMKDARNASIDSTRLAKFFDVGKVVERVMALDPDHSPSLITGEVFEAIDDAGYRPVNVVELLAFARDAWKPSLHSEQLTEKQQLHKVDADRIVTFGSICANPNNTYDSSVLTYIAYGTDLPEPWFGTEEIGGQFSNNWSSWSRILVVRKEFF